MGAVPAVKVGALDGAHPLAMAANVQATTMRCGLCAAAMRVDRIDVSTRAWPRMIMVWRQQESSISERPCHIHASRGKKRRYRAPAVPCTGSRTVAVTGGSSHPCAAERSQDSAKNFGAS